VREVARRIGRAPSTISRELHRSAATRAPRHWNCPGTHPGFDERCQRRQQAARPRSCPDTTPPADASTTFASPANDDPTRSCRPGTGRCRLGCAEQSRFIWRPSSRTGLRQWHIHWPRAPHAVTVPMENDASTAASPRPRRPQPETRALRPLVLLFKLGGRSERLSPSPILGRPASAMTTSAAGAKCSLATHRLRRATRAAKSLPGTRHHRRCGVGAESRRAGVDPYRRRRTHRRPRE